MKSLICCILSITLAVVLASASSFADLAAVPHIQNPASPPGGLERLQLEELWRVGGADEEIIFGMIADVIAADDGNGEGEGEPLDLICFRIGQ